MVPLHAAGASGFHNPADAPEKAALSRRGHTGPGRFVRGTTDSGHGPWRSQDIDDNVRLAHLDGQRGMLQPSDVGEGRRGWDANTIRSRR